MTDYAALAAQYDDAPAVGTPVIIQMAAVQPQCVEWLWPGRVPLGKLTVLEGDPGLGKSTLTLDLAARVSRGARMPDGVPGASGGVVILTAEDGLADTVRPRLDAAGAELDWIIALTGVRLEEQGFERQPVLPGDLPALASAITDVQAKLVVVDPLFAYLGGATDTFKDADIRRALAPLAGLAETSGAAVVVVRHWTKGQGNALYRGGGSIGITAAARSVLLVARDPDDPDEHGCRVFASAKSNLSAPPPSLTYRIEPAGSSTRISWVGVSPHRADALAAAPDDEMGSAVDDAREFLKDKLQDGPVPVPEVQAAAKAAGLAWITVRRAKDDLQVAATKPDFKSGWVWALPPKALTPPSPPGMSTFGGDEHLRTVPTTYEGASGTAETKALTGGERAPSARWRAPPPAVVEDRYGI